MQIIDFLYSYFLIILVIMTMIILFLSGFIVTVAKKRIGDIVFEFDDNTIVRHKAKKKGKTITYSGRSIGKLYTPRLYKKGMFTNRAYIVEENAIATTPASLNSFITFFDSFVFNSLGIFLLES